MSSARPARQLAITAVAVARVGVGAVALVAPQAVRIATGGPSLDPRAEAFVRMVGARDLVLGAALLPNRSRPRVSRVVASAGAAADLGDCVASLLVATTANRAPRGRWLAMAGSGIASAVVTAIALGADRRHTG